MKQLASDVRNNGGKSTQERIDEQMEVQRQVLKDRQQRKGISDAQKRRRQVSKYMRNPKAQKKVRENKRDKLRREGPYPQEQGNSFSLGGIVIPQVPFGVKEYEGVESERFDLIGPYAEEGYVDVSADAMSRLRNFLSFGRKQDDSSNTSKDKRKQQQRNGKNKFK